MTSYRQIEANRRECTEEYQPEKGVAGSTLSGGARLASEMLFTGGSIDFDFTLHPFSPSIRSLNPLSA
jgi:hypothetical protein